MDYNLFRKIVEKETGILLSPEYKFCLRRWRFDFAIVELKIAIEIEGAVYSNGRHTRGSGFVKDTEKYNKATSMGWAVLRFPSQEILKNETIDTIKQTIKNRTSTP